MNTASIEINCDMGEGYGRWRFAPDEEFMPYVSAANIACGFHAGDPRIMRRTVRAAIAQGLQIGAHVALPDLMGFGRRRMAVSAEELQDYTLYQIGALKAFVEAEGSSLSHVKPHGVMYVMSLEDAELAEAVIAAVAEIDSALLLYSFDKRHAELAGRFGIRLVQEGFADLAYDDAGNLIIEREKQAWDPALVSSRAIRLVREGKVTAESGRDLDILPESICLHGDAPNSVDVIRTVWQSLHNSGISVRPLTKTGNASVEPG
ncbi:LamB/YcsF family protein [Arthrobacter sp. GCM10027362]|uniref:LamB/YcsF family protein n=1 Tax=Arthrobacter sp. GCM10027362 TaxID=3273379 RepID=UPI0036351FA2